MWKTHPTPIKPQGLPRASWPQEADGMPPSLAPQVQGPKCKGRSRPRHPARAIPDRQAIPVSDMKCFHSFRPYAAASASGGIIFVPWLALVWGDGVRCLSTPPLNTPSSSLAFGGSSLKLTQFSFLCFQLDDCPLEGPIRHFPKFFIHFIHQWARK